MDSPTARERMIAQRLLAENHASGSTAAPHDPLQRILRDLHRQFISWFGTDGARLMLSRAVERAQLSNGLRNALRVSIVNDELLLISSETLDEVKLSPQESEVVIAAILSLATRLVGVKLVDRLLQQRWPGIARSEFSEQRDLKAEDSHRD